MPTRSHRRRGSLPRRLLLVLAAALISFCGRPALQHTLESPDALAAAILDGIARNDRASLEALALSESEFREAVWPELPAARPERNLRWDYVWKDLNQKSRAGLTQLLSQHGGRVYRLEGVTFTAESTNYSTFQVSRESQLLVRDATGTAQRIRAFGSMISREGRYKVFSYVVD